MEPLRICIGTERRTTIPRKVLEYSVRANLPAGVAPQFFPLEGGDWKKRGPGEQYTGFSFLRWTIPERFDWKGRSIYLDADQLCVADISELWRADEIWPAPGACVWCTAYPRRRRRWGLPFLKYSIDVPESSVMLIDCEKARGRLMSSTQIEEHLADDRNLVRYREVMSLSYLDPPPRLIPQWWNLMDGWGRRIDSFEDERAKLLHFTDLPKQPWYFPDHSKRHLWESYLRRARDEGYVTGEEIADACDRFDPISGRPDGMHPYWRRYA